MLSADGCIRYVISALVCVQPIIGVTKKSRRVSLFLLLALGFARVFPIWEIVAIENVSLNFV